MSVIIAILAVGTTVQFSDPDSGDYRLVAVDNVEWNGGNYDVTFWPASSSPWDIPSYRSILPPEQPYGDGIWPLYYRYVDWVSAVNGMAVPAENVNLSTNVIGRPDHWDANITGDELIIHGWHYQLAQGPALAYEAYEDFTGDFVEIVPKWPAGDANKDSQFNTADLVTVFVAGEYEDAVPRNSRWDEGDWDGNLEFDTADLVLALARGYETPAARAVPEPSCLMLIGWGCVALVRRIPTTNSVHPPPESSENARLTGRRRQLQAPRGICQAHM